MTILFLISMIVSGFYDLRFRQVPLWSIGLAGLTGFGMCFQHPVFSVMSGVTLLIICMFNKMGPADKILYPIAAAAFGMLGVLIAGTALALAAHKGKNEPAPGVTYLAAVVLAATLIGGLL